jgi:transcriptional regulator with XRE-family HTH domain
VTEKRERGSFPSIGRAIRLVRTERGMNRKELAERSGLSYPYLSEIESGKKTPSSNAIGAIADALGIPAHRLVQVAETSLEGAPGTWMETGSSHFHEDAVRSAAFVAAPVPLADAMMPPPPQAAPARRLGRTKKTREVSAPPVRSSPELDELMALAAGMPPADRARLLDLARRLRG